jgi:hypothetical protein
MKKLLSWHLFVHGILLLLLPPPTIFKLMVATLHVGFMFDEIAGLRISWLSLSVNHPFLHC